MSAFGPKRTSHFAPHMSAFGGKVDIRFLPITVFIGCNPPRGQLRKVVFRRCYSCARGEEASHVVQCDELANSIRTCAFTRSRIVFRLSNPDWSSDGRMHCAKRD